MSQRGPASGPPASKPQESHEPRPLVSSRPPSSHNTQNVQSQLNQLATATRLAPQAQSTSPGSSTLENVPPPVLPASTPSRAIGVQSILNPLPPETARSGNIQPRPGFYHGSPRQTTATTPASPALPRIAKRSSRASPPAESSSVARRTERRVLTPRSPSLRAGHTSGKRGGPSASIVPSQSPLFRDEPRVYTAEPGSDQTSEIPPLPPPAGLSRTAYPYPLPGEASVEQSRGASASRGPFTGLVGQSQGDSTSPSVSSYGQSSPVARFGLLSQTVPAYQHTASSQSMQDALTRPARGVGEGQYDLGRGSYQITLDTEQGPMVVPVEIDMQQASRVADEKRRRNAGASARFRQRRKEREREQSETISSLENRLRDTEDRVRDAEERASYYQGETHFWRDSYVRAVGPANLPGRPPSPRSRRFPPPPLPPPLEAPLQHWQEPPVDEPPPRNIRRRTSEFSTAFPTQPLPPPMVPPQGLSLISPITSATTAYQTPFSQTRPVGGPLPTPSPRSSTYDPFRRDPYNRSGNPP